MAKPRIELVEALRRTADKLEKGAKYQWGHMGSCNCGHLAQELTTYTKEQIHAYALQTRMGDWAEQTAAFCGESKLPLDLVISSMLDAGLTNEDLIHLERLSDQQILRRFPIPKRHQFEKNNRADLILYLRAWADLLEEQLVEKIQLGDLFTSPVAA